MTAACNAFRLMSKTMIPAPATNSTAASTAACRSPAPAARGMAAMGAQNTTPPTACAATPMRRVTRGENCAEEPARCAGAEGQPDQARAGPGPGSRRGRQGPRQEREEVEAGAARQRGAQVGMVDDEAHPLTCPGQQGGLAGRLGRRFDDPHPSDRDGRDDKDGVHQQRDRRGQHLDEQPAHRRARDERGRPGAARAGSSRSGTGPCGPGARRRTRTPSGRTPRPRPRPRAPRCTGGPG